VKKNLDQLDPNPDAEKTDEKRDDDQVAQKNKPRPGPPGKS
jgi:hypothetical protein